jgi:hypothetical protein
MSRRLPSKPNLVQLKHQAKNLLKAHRRGDKSACRTLRLLHRFAGQSDEAILSAMLTLAEAQYALAMDYGFEKWTALKNRVAPELSPQASADPRLLCRPYSYNAVTLGRQFQTGVVNARNAEDAVARMRKDGLIPVSLQKQGATQEDSPSGTPNGHTAAVARQAVELILLSSVAAADRELRFAPGRPPFRQPDGTLATCRPAFDLRGPGQRVSAVPFPPEIGGQELLGALRDMSGDKRLGRGSLRVRSVVTIGQGLPDGIPRRIDLLFRSDGQDRPVSVKLMRPGSRGVTRAPLDKILKAIERALGRYPKVHVLTPPGPRTQEIAKALARRIHEKQVAVLERSAKTLPDASIVVANAGEMAILLIMARIRGEAAATAFEGTLAKTLAVCVDLADDIDPLYSWQPSTITDEKGELGSITPSTLLMFYGKVREFRQTDGG